MKLCKASPFRLLAFSVHWSGGEISVEHVCTPIAVSEWQHKYIIFPSPSPFSPATCHDPQIRYIPSHAPRHLHLYHPLTEQSFIKLFHALSGMGTWGVGVYFVPLLERHGIIPNSLQPTAENCRTLGVNVEGVAFHLLADPAAFLLYSQVGKHTQANCMHGFKSTEVYYNYFYQ